MGLHLGAPQITGMVIRQRGTDLYWSQEDRWDERLSVAKRWSDYHDLVESARSHHWPETEQVWLGWKDCILEVHPTHFDFKQN